MKIEVKPIIMKAQVPKKVEYSYIELHENYIDYYVKFHGEKPVNPEDDMLGWDESFTCFETTAIKKYVSGVEKYYTLEKQWGVYIMTIGFQDDIKCFFDGEEDATKFRDIVKKWLLK